MPIYEKLMGNPFVDAGICGICEWLGPKVQPEQITTDDLEQIVEEVVPIMKPLDKKRPEAHGWQNWVSIFTTNHKLTSPSDKGDRVAKFKKLLLSHIDKLEALGPSGNCIGCGRREANERLLKTGVPLTGSGNLRNFFPAFDWGVGYCSACAFAIQLSPLAFVASGGRFLIIHSNFYGALRMWTRKCVKDIRAQQLRREISGCFNPGYSNPRNGLFYMTQEMIQLEERRPDENVSMQVYCFTNYNQGPELEVFYMPAPVFRFLRFAYQSEFITAWQEIVKSGYYKVNWDKVKSEEDYKNSTNRVYESLLQGRSILRSFLNRHARKPRGNWKLLSLYLKEVRNMDQTKLDKIKEVGDYIAESIRKSERDKRLRQLERARSYRECRIVLRFIARDRISQEFQEPLFSLDDYMQYLFPASDNMTFWSETRDLLLFRLYEQLHDWLQTQGFVEFDENETSGEDELSETDALEEN